MFVVQAARNWLWLIRQHRTFAIGGFIVGSLVFLSLATVWPKRYQAKVTVAIDPAYTLQADPVSQLATMNRAISQATTKQQWAAIITRLGLYPKTIANGGLNQATSDLASQVSIAPGKDPKLGGFVVRVAYAGRDPRLVLAVTNAVAENLTTPASLLLPTAVTPPSTRAATPGKAPRTVLRKGQLSQSAASSHRKYSYAPALTGQLQAAIAEGVKLQLALSENSLELDQLRKQLTREDEARNQENPAPAIAQQMRKVEAEPAATEPPQLDPQIERLQQDLAQQQHTLADLRARYTDDYPDVIAEQDKVRDLQLDLSRLTALKPHVAKAAPPVVPKAPAQAIDPARKQQLAQQLAEAESVHDQLQQSVAHNQAVVAGLQAKIQIAGADSSNSLATVPTVQPELSQLSSPVDAVSSSANPTSSIATQSSDITGGSSASPTLVLAQGPVMTVSPFLFTGGISVFLSIVFGSLIASFAAWLAEQSDPSIRNEVMLRNELPASAVFLGGIPRVHHEVVSS